MARDATRLDDVLASWRLPAGGDLLQSIEEMIRPAVLAGVFGAGKGFTRYVAIHQYHLSGVQDTRELAELAHLRPGLEVLDVACYLGGPSLQLALDHGCHVTGIDQDEHLIAAARRIATLAGLDNLLSYQVADALQLPFADATFDVVWSQCTMTTSWLDEMHRVLRPGGKIAATTAVSGAASDTLPTLQELSGQIANLGYDVLDASDISERDIRVGWHGLIAKLRRERDVYVDALGEQWVADAVANFENEARNMSAGRWRNARVVARKAQA